MAARAIWKGVILVDELQIPVKFYSAVEDRNLHFHLLHDQDLARLKQQMVHSKTNRVVPRDKFQKGLEIEDGRFVPFTDEELQQLDPPASRDIEIKQFVAPDAIDHQWYVRPYWLGPDGDEDSYFSLTTAMDKEGVAGIAHWTMRKNRYIGALMVQQDYLCMITMRHAAEVISADQLDPPKGRALDKREHKMAEQLITALEDDFNPRAYRDEYRDRVLEFIHAKHDGMPIEPPTYEDVPETDDLAASLAASLKGLGA